MMIYGDWVENARCRNVNSDMHFGGTNREGIGSARLKRKAREVCERCPVKDSCLSLVLHLDRTLGLQYGVWGGLGERERRRMLRAEREQEAVAA